jgi:uncharacterized phage protein (TIGR02218 family)
MQIVPYIVKQLFEFVCGTETFYYTSSALAETVGANTYIPKVIAVGPIAASTEQAKNGVVITVDSMNPVAALFTPTAPPFPVEVIIKRFNEGGLGLTDLVWSGTALGAVWTETDECEITCEPITVSFGRNGLARRYTKRCPYALYDADTCKVSSATWAHTTTVTGLIGSAITVASGLGIPYAGGYVEWNNGTHLERRYIEGHLANVLGLMQPFTGVTIGATVVIYPGCDRKIATCHATFNNRINYGGFPYMRTVNVFKNGFGNYQEIDTYVPNSDNFAAIRSQIAALNPP